MMYNNQKSLAEVTSEVTAAKNKQKNKTKHTHTHTHKTKKQSKTKQNTNHEPLFQLQFVDVNLLQT